MSEPSAPASPLAPRRHHVLVVDDEADIRETIRDLFEAYLPNVQVTLAGSGVEAVGALERRAFDLILTDYKMPGMSGLQLLQESRRVSPAMPRVMMTAFPDLELAIKAINEGGIEMFLTKPLERDATLEVVRAALAQRLSRELRDRAFARAMESMRKRGSPAPAAA